MPKDAPNDSDAFVTEVCWHYFINEMTQAEIAEALGVTRLRVNQAIQRAKQSGMVKVQIESPFLPRLELQQELRARFGLEDAIVAAANPQDYDYHRPAGAALASYLMDSFKSKSWKKIGVSWGMTLQAAINRMAQQSCPDLEIISMIGGTSQGAQFNSFGIASGFAERLGAKYSLLAAPVFLSEGVDLELFLSQALFQTHFAKFRELDAAILTASNLSTLSYLISTGLPDEIKAADLTAAGVVGDVVGRFLDKDGDVVSNALDGRTIGIDLATLRSIPDRILAAAGHHKVDIILAALRRGIANTLVTDDVTARLLLDRA
jgi:DNA-binding transcriptional regulator LsrR (DeoR family)